VVGELPVGGAVVVGAAVGAAVGDVVVGAVVDVGAAVVVVGQVFVRRQLAVGWAEPSGASEVMANTVETARIGVMMRMMIA
jgi:hypothetical protein